MKRHSEDRNRFVSNADAQNFAKGEFGTASVFPPPLSFTTHYGQAIQRQEEDSQESTAIREESYFRITNEQQLIIQGHTSRIHAIMQEWGRIRGHHIHSRPGESYEEYMEKVRILRRELYQAFNQLDDDFSEQSFFTTSQEQDSVGWRHEHNESIFHFELFRHEVFRQLNTGSFPQFFKELMALHGWEPGESSLISYYRLFREFDNFELSPQTHNYRLRILLGVEGDANVSGTSASASIRGYIVEYENSYLDLSWEMRLGTGSVDVRTGYSTPDDQTFGSSFDTSLGQDWLNAGIAQELRYYSPSYFSQTHLLQGMSADAQASMGMSAGASLSILAIGDVEFNTSGLTGEVNARLGAALTIGAELGIVNGENHTTHFHGLSEEVEDREREAQDNSWHEFVDANVYFRTEEYQLDRDDLITLLEIKESIERHHHFYPGDVFRMEFTGYATERWRTPVRSAREYREHGLEIRSNLSDLDEDTVRLGMNQTWANLRAHNCRDIMIRVLQNRDDSQVNPLVIEESEFVINTPQIYEPESDNESEGPDNSSEGRKVNIKVKYHLNNTGNIPLIT